MPAEQRANGARSLSVSEARRLEPNDPSRRLGAVSHGGGSRRLPLARGSQPSLARDGRPRSPRGVAKPATGQEGSAVWPTLRAGLARQPKLSARAGPTGGSPHLWRVAWQLRQLKQRSRPRHTLCASGKPHLEHALSATVSAQSSRHRRPLDSRPPSTGLGEVLHPRDSQRWLSHLLGCCRTGKRCTVQLLWSLARFLGRASVGLAAGACIPGHSGLGRRSPHGQAPLDPNSSPLLGVSSGFSVASRCDLPVAPRARGTRQAGGRTKWTATGCLACLASRSRL